MEPLCHLLATKQHFVLCMSESHCIYQINTSMSPQSDCISILFIVSLPQFFSLFQIFCLQSFSHGATKRIKASRVCSDEQHFKLHCVIRTSVPHSPHVISQTCPPKLAVYLSCKMCHLSLWHVSTTAAALHCCLLFWPRQHPSVGSGRVGVGGLLLSLQFYV